MSSKCHPFCSGLTLSNSDNRARYTGEIINNLTASDHKGCWRNLPEEMTHVQRILARVFFTICFVLVSLQRRGITIMTSQTTSNSIFSLNSLIRLTVKETSQLRITALLNGNPLVARLRARTTVFRHANPTATTGSSSGRGIILTNNQSNRDSYQNGNYIAIN